MLLSFSPLKEKVWFKIFEKGWIDLYNDVLWANYSVLEDTNMKCANCLNVNVYVKYSVCA